MSKPPRSIGAPDPEVIRLRAQNERLRARLAASGLLGEPINALNGDEQRALDTPLAVETLLILCERQLGVLQLLHEEITATQRAVRSYLDHHRRT